MTSGLSSIRFSQRQPSKAAFHLPSLLERSFSIMGDPDMEIKLDAGWELDPICNRCVHPIDTVITNDMRKKFLSDLKEIEKQEIEQEARDE